MRTMTLAELLARLGDFKDSQNSAVYVQIGSQSYTVRAVEMTYTRGLEILADPEISECRCSFALPLTAEEMQQHLKTVHSKKEAAK